MYLFRVTRGQSCLTSNYQEQPQLRPSINKIMHNEGRRTEDEVVWGRGGERRGQGEWKEDRHSLVRDRDLGLHSRAHTSRHCVEIAVCVLVFTS